MTGAFIAVALLSFAALVIPFISLPASLLIPIGAFLVSPLSAMAAWAAWALGAVGFVYMPAVQAALKRIDTYLIRRKEGQPMSLMPQLHDIVNIGHSQHHVRA